MADKKRASKSGRVHESLASDAAAPDSKMIFWWRAEVVRRIGLFGRILAVLPLTTLTSCYHINPVSVAVPGPGPKCIIQEQDTVYLTNPPTPNPTPTLVAMTAGFAKHVKLTFTWMPLLNEGTIIGSGAKVTFDLRQVPRPQTDVEVTISGSDGTSAHCDTEIPNPLFKPPTPQP
jgi:hypothetical protein